MKTLLTILSTLTFFFATGRTIPVGSGLPVTSIRKALTMAREGDTILVNAGVYREGNIIISRPVAIRGNGNPILDGENKYENFTVSGKNILIEGLTFRNSGYSAMNDYASIKVIDAANVTIENNTILNAYFAIHVSNTTHATIRHNSISGSPKSEQLTGNGIHLWKSNYALIDGSSLQVTGMGFLKLSPSPLFRTTSVKTTFVTAFTLCSPMMTSISTIRSKGTEPV